MDKQKQNYAALQQLTTDQLKQLLIADFDSESGDPELVDRVLAILATREPQTDVEQAWKNFQTYYNTEDGKDSSLFEAQKPAAKPKKQLLRILAAAAVIALALLSISPPATGTGGIFRTITRWTGSNFTLDVEHPSAQDVPKVPAFSSDNADLTKLYNTLLDHGANGVTPSWIPEGFLLDHIQEVSTEYDHTVVAQFYRSSQSLVLSVSFTDSPDLSYVEKDSSPVTQYTTHGITHYLMHNNKNLVCVWYREGAYCLLGGPLTESEMYKIIDSIYEEVLP